VGAWVYKNFDEISGISFLPHTDHSYVQAPYQEVDKETFRKALKETPQLINFEELIETDDNTEGAQTLACVGSSCEIT
jgi:ribonucleoside-diphosphate reductase alpha chain